MVERILNESIYDELYDLYEKYDLKLTQIIEINIYSKEISSQYWKTIYKDILLLLEMHKILYTDKINYNLISFLEESFYDEDLGRLIKIFTP